MKYYVKFNVMGRYDYLGYKEEYFEADSVSNLKKSIKEYVETHEVNGLEYLVDEIKDSNNNKID